MPYYYVGRTTTYSGKNLYDILSKLKNWGVGRMVYRNLFHERYPEKSYYIITEVHPHMKDRIDKYNITTFNEVKIKSSVCILLINVL